MIHGNLEMTTLLTDSDSNLHVTIFCLLSNTGAFLRARYINSQTPITFVKHSYGTQQNILSATFPVCVAKWFYLRASAQKTSTTQIFFILWLQSDNELPM